MKRVAEGRPTRESIPHIDNDEKYLRPSFMSSAKDQGCEKGGKVGEFRGRNSSFLELAMYSRLVAVAERRKFVSESPQPPSPLWQNSS